MKTVTDGDCTWRQLPAGDHSVNLVLLDLDSVVSGWELYLGVQPATVDEVIRYLLNVFILSGYTSRKRLSMGACVASENIFRCIVIEPDKGK